MVSVIGNSKILTFTDPQEQLPKGEVEWASVIRDALRGEPLTFVETSEGTLGGLVKRIVNSEESNLWVLDEEGTPLIDNRKINPAIKNSFMLGDHRGFDSEAESIISQYNIQKISLGGKSYLSSHCLAAIISEFERMVR
jgi:tRNA pseudouridine-54 N-methylase